MRLLLALTLSILLPASASAAPEQAPAEQTSARDCFLSRNWQGWSVAPEGDALYLRMQGGDIYRAELGPNARVRRHLGEFLVNEVRGSSWICTALDLDLAISDTNGFSRPLIATGLRKLTPEEAAAIAPEDRPY
ncbi:MAG: DUF6491 family protein [Vitreimonas sp.]